MSAKDKIVEGFREILGNQSDDMRQINAKVIGELGEFYAFTLGNVVGRLVRTFGAEEAERILTIFITYIASVQ